jgi:hypothetical protein
MCDFVDLPNWHPDMGIKRYSRGEAAAKTQTSPLDGEMMKKPVMLIVFLASSALGCLSTGGSVSAENCRYDTWGSNWMRGQKYKCSDGSSLYIQPGLGSLSSWDSTPANPWESWKGRDTYGNSYRCTWDSWRLAWKCR